MLFWLAVPGLPQATIDLEPKPDFGDVPATHEYYSYVQYLRERSITLGVDAINYGVGGTLTRQQAAAFLVRAIFWATSGKISGKGLGGITGDPAYAYSNSPYFGDLTATTLESNPQLFYEAQKAKELGIINGFSTQRFEPTWPVNRGTMIALSVRAMEARTRGAGWQKRNYGDDKKWCFSDVRPDHAFFHEIWKAQQMGVITGDCKLFPGETPSIALNEGQTITRGEAAKYIVAIALGVPNPITLKYTGSCPAGQQQCQGGQSGVPPQSLGREYIRGLGRAIATEVLLGSTGLGESNNFPAGVNGGSTAPFQIWPSAVLDTQKDLRSSSNYLVWKLQPNEEENSYQGALNVGDTFQTDQVTYFPPSPVPPRTCQIGSLRGVTGRPCVYSLSIRGSLPADPNQTNVAFVTLTPPETTSNTSAAPVTSAFTVAGGNASVQVLAPTGVAWQMTSSASWLRPTGNTAGAGAGTVSYAVDPNTSNYGPRSATLSLNGLSRHEVMQGGTWGNWAPNIVSVGPTSGNGANGTFTIVAQDPDGHQNIDLMQLVLGGGPTATPACVVIYRRPENRFYLADNTGAEVALLSANAENSNCVLNIAGTSASTAGQMQLSVAANLTFKASFAGQKNIYAFAQDTLGSNIGWATWGTWTVPTPPVVVTAWSNKYALRASESAQFSATVSGTTQTGVTWSDGGRGGYFYQPNSNSTSYLAPGSFIPSSTPLTIRATSTADPTKFATFTVTYRNSAPQAVSVNPTTGSGMGPVTFTYTFQDGDGSWDLATVEMLQWSDGAYGGGGCQVSYDVGSGTVTLHGYGGSSSSFGSGTLDGQFCTVDLAASSANVSGNNVTVALRVTFKSTFFGSSYWTPNLTLRGRATDIPGVSSGLQDLGTWYVQ